MTTAEETSSSVYNPRMEYAWWQVLLLTVAYLSGILSIFRDIIGMYSERNERSVFWKCVAIAFILSAVTVIWTRGKEIENLHAALVKSKPDLSGAIERISVGPAKDSPDDSLCFIFAKIKNKGTPSSIDNVRVSVILASGRKIVATPLQPPVGNFTITQNGNATVLPAERNLVSVGFNPIPTGGLIDGFLCALLRGVPINEANKGIPGVELSFDDINGQQVVVRELNMSPTIILNGTQFFSGK